MRDVLEDIATSGPMMPDFEKDLQRSRNSLL